MFNELDESKHKAFWNLCKVLPEGERPECLVYIMGISQDVVWVDGLRDADGAAMADVWKERIEHLDRSTCQHHLHPNPMPWHPIPDVERRFGLARLHMPTYLYKFALQPDLLAQMADAAYDHEAYSEVYLTTWKRLEAELHRRNVAARKVTLEEVRQRKAQERKRRDVDEAGLPEGPPRGKSNILRKSKERR